MSVTVDDVANFDRILSQLKEADGALVPTPARFVGELIIQAGITHWHDAEIGTDRIKEFAVQGMIISDPCIVITGLVGVGGYDPEDTVSVAVRPANGR